MRATRTGGSQAALEKVGQTTIGSGPSSTPNPSNSKGAAPSPSPSSPSDSPPSPSNRLTREAVGLPSAGDRHRRAERRSLDATRAAVACRDTFLSREKSEEKEDEDDEEEEGEAAVLVAAAPKSRASAMTVSPPRPRRRFGRGARMGAAQHSGGCPPFVRTPAKRERLFACISWPTRRSALFVAKTASSVVRVEEPSSDVNAAAHHVRPPAIMGVSASIGSPGTLVREGSEKGGNLPRKMLKELIDTCRRKPDGFQLPTKFGFKPYSANRV